MSRRIVPLLLGLAVLVAIVLSVGSGSSDSYTVKMRLLNAGGLRDGSPVVIGGVPIGKVKLHAHREYVEADLDIKKKYAPIGKNAIAGIIAQNVIGQKQVRVQVGNTKDAAPDGYTIPAKQVLETTDLDQLLSTLDPNTRTRLAILINETGSAFAGRKLDFSTFMKDFAPALSSGSNVLNQLTTDNQALTRLVDTSDRFVASLAQNRKTLSRTLDNAGKAAETVAARRAQLRATLRTAPAGLRAARGFLAELRATTQPLDQTAKLLTKTSPSLAQILQRVPTFEQQAGPNIRALQPLGAIAARTGTKVSKPMARLIPTTAMLNQLVRTETPPAAATINGSIENALAAVDNWAHAIQFRDGLGHVFRGEAGLSPDYYRSLLSHLGPNAVSTTPQARKKQAPAKSATPKLPDVTGPATKTLVPKLPKLPEVKLPPVITDLGKNVGDAVKKVLPPALGGTASGPGSGAKGSGSAGTLLDYLLGN